MGMAGLCGQWNFVARPGRFDARMYLLSQLRDVLFFVEVLILRHGCEGFCFPELVMKTRNATRGLVARALFRGCRLQVQIVLCMVLKRFVFVFS